MIGTNKDQTVYPYVLIIIDMQESFFASNYVDTIAVIQFLIKRAIQNKSFIIICEFLGSGLTIKNIRDLVINYEHCSFVTGIKRDKSEVINNELVSKNINFNYIEVSGINTEECVEATTEGLCRLRKTTRIHVINNGCNTCNDISIHNYAMRMMSKLQNVFILSVDVDDKFESRQFNVLRDKEPKGNLIY